MTADIRSLHTAAREADARCQTARKLAEEAQARRYWPGGLGRDVVDAEVALERFLVAADVRERAWRAVRSAEEAIDQKASA